MWNRTIGQPLLDLDPVVPAQPRVIVPTGQMSTAERMEALTRLPALDVPGVATPLSDPQAEQQRQQQEKQQQEKQRLEKQRQEKQQQEKQQQEKQRLEKQRQQQEQAAAARTTRLWVGGAALVVVVGVIGVAIFNPKALGFGKGVSGKRRKLSGKRRKR